MEFPVFETQRWQYYKKQLPRDEHEVPPSEAHSRFYLLTVVLESPWFPLHGVARFWFFKRRDQCATFHWNRFLMNVLYHAFGWFVIYRFLLKRTSWGKARYSIEINYTVVPCHRYYSVSIVWHRYLNPRACRLRDHRRRLSPELRYTLHHTRNNFYLWNVVLIV